MKSARITVTLWCIFVICFYILDGSSFGSVLLPVTFGVLILCGIFTALSGRKAELSITAPANVNKGERIFIELRLLNRSIVPVCRFCFTLVSANAITGEVSRERFSLSAVSKGRALIAAELEEAFCGLVEFEIEKPKIMDPLCIFSVNRGGLAKAITYVMPQMQELPLEPEELNAYDMESYVYSISQKGNDPSETFGIREYIQGDSPKTIHWKLTGKVGDVMVRELGLPVENSILVLIDKRMEKGEALEPKMRDRATELFLSVSHTLLQKDMSHSVGWQDYKNGLFILRRITCQQDLWTALGLVLASPYREDAASTPVHYLENCGDQRFANCLYVTAGQNPDEARLEGQSAITVYRAENYK